MVVATTHVFDEGPGIAEGLGCRNHVERHRKRTAFVYVVHPELRTSKLPLNVAVSLRGSKANTTIDVASLLYL